MFWAIEMSIGREDVGSSRPTSIPGDISCLKETSPPPRILNEAKSDHVSSRLFICVSFPTVLNSSIKQVSNPVLTLSNRLVVEVAIQGTETWTFFRGGSFQIDDILTYTVGLSLPY